MKRFKLATARGMSRLDRFAINTLGIPSLVLMESAGRALADEAILCLRRRKNPRVVILCGTGHNGGDGLCAARYLSNHGVNVAVFVIGRRRDLKPDTAVEAKIFERGGGIIVFQFALSVSLKRKMSQCDLIIDALFGVGLHRPLQEPFIAVIQAMNTSRIPILSADIPSGLDATSGCLWGVGVKAWRTVTFSCLKKGFYGPEGPGVTGKIIVKDIGIPKGCLTLATSSV